MNVKFSKYQKQLPGRVLLRRSSLKFLQNLLQNIRAAVCTLITFKTKRSANLLKRDSDICTSLRISQKFQNVYFVERRRTATSEISYKNQNSITGKIIRVGGKILRKKNRNTVSNRPELNVQKTSMSSEQFHTP